MPRGPNGEQRPADAVGCAVMVAKIATGEVEEVSRRPRRRVVSEVAAAESACGTDDHSASQD